MKAYEKFINKSCIATIVCLCSLIYFIIIALYHLHLPGIYYDEAIFAPVTLKALENCKIQAAVSYQIGCFSIMQSPPYVGALKANLYIPVFWLLNVTPESIRLPMLMVSGIILFLTYRFTKQRLGPLAAAAVIVLLGTDPAFIFHSRIDWGPFVLANLFKLLAVGLCVKWLESSRTLYLALTLLTLILGFYDKLNFVWVIIALFLSVIIVYPIQAWESFKQNRLINSYLIFSFTIIAVIIIVTLVLPAMSLNIGGAEYDLKFQIAKVQQLYKGTVTAEGLFSWVFNQSFNVFTWTPLLIWPQLMFGIFISIYQLFKPSSPCSAARLLAFINTILIILIVQLIATKEVGGSHHLIVLWPFYYLQLVLCGAVIFDFLRKYGRIAAIDYAFLSIAVVVVALIALQHISVSKAYAGALQDNASYKPRFDPIIYKLVDALKDDPADIIISVDWGIHQSALSLAESQQRAKYNDWWPFFMQPAGADSKRDDWIRSTFLTDKQALFINHFPEVSTFPATVDNFKKYLAYWRFCPKEVKIIKNKEGASFYEVLRVDTRNDICPDEAQSPQE